MNPTPHSRPVFHLLPNAHLDPVWFWDWREGLNEGVATVRAVLRLMEEFPELTFIRGEASIYQHIEKTAPALFCEVEAMIEAGRWDVVGGTYVQPDSNLPATETLCRQFERGLAYFETRFGSAPSAAWQADSFGHTPGWPNILAAFGMREFAFTRPQRGQFPLDSPVFHWQGSAPLLCYRQHWPWYCSERANLPEVLAWTLQEAARHPFKNIGVLIGLGNHGGGPSRRHLLDVERWRRDHPEVELRYSTLHGFFRDLRQELATLPAEAAPSVRGDLGYCLRGCYSSLQKFKTLYRQAEVAVGESESTASIITQTLGLEPPRLDKAWDALLFNAFHDILPGSSIERAMDEQAAWVGMALHQAAEARFTALNELAARVDTSVAAPAHPDHPTPVPFLVWNPRPHGYKGLVEIEASLDYRPLYAYEGRAHEVGVSVTGADREALPFQIVATEHTSMPHLPWRKRVVVPVALPAFGWSLVHVGWDEASAPAPTPPPSPGQPHRCGEGGIAGNGWSVEAAADKLRILRHGATFWNTEGEMGLYVVDDPWGSWGGMHEEEEATHLNNVREVWSLTRVKVLEEGPLRSRLWTRWEGRNSWITLTFSIEDGNPALQVQARLLWNERSARLKLSLPCAGQAQFDVPGDVVKRDASGQLPCGRWVRRTSPAGSVGFASDALSDIDFTGEELRVTLARATRYANDVPTGPDEQLWLPAVDCGELKFAFSLFDGETNPDDVVESLQSRPAPLMVDAHTGALPPSGSLGSVEPESLRLLSVQARPEGVLVRLQNRGAEPTNGHFNLNGTRTPIPVLESQEICTLLLNPRDASCSASKLNEK